MHPRGKREGDCCRVMRFTGGMIYEGMNNIRNSLRNLIVILNDNKMSISKNIGSMAQYLYKASHNRAISRPSATCRARWTLCRLWACHPSGPAGSQKRRAPHDVSFHHV